AVPVSDVDLGQPSSRRRDPVADVVGLPAGERRIDEHRVVAPHDQRRRDLRPHPSAAVRQRAPARLRNLFGDKHFVLQWRVHSVSLATGTPPTTVLNSRIIDATSSGYSTCTQWPPSLMTSTSTPPLKRGLMTSIICSVTNPSASP